MAGDGGRTNKNDSSPPRGTWGQPALAIVAAAFLICAAVLAIVSVSYHQVTTVTVRGHVKTTVSGPPGPSVGLISATLGAGVALLLLAAFFNRILEFNSPFGSLKLGPEEGALVARKAAEKAGGDPEMTAKIYERIAPQVAMASEEGLRPTKNEAWQRRRAVIMRAADPNWIDKLASDAAKEV